MRNTVRLLCLIDCSLLMTFHIVWITALAWLCSISRIGNLSNQKIVSPKRKVELCLKIKMPTFELK